MVTVIKEWDSKQSATFSLPYIICPEKMMALKSSSLLFSPDLTFSWQFQDLLKHHHAHTRIQQGCLRAYSSYSILPFRHDFLRGKFYHIG